MSRRKAERPVRTPTGDWQVAVDPGNNGAIVAGRVVEGRLCVAAAVTWQHRVRKAGPCWVVRAGGEGWGSQERTTGSLFAVGEGFARWCDELGVGAYRLTVEGLFGRGPTLERLSWYAGLVAGPLLDGAVGAIERPLATSWRSEVLGVRGGTPADEAEQAAIEWARENVLGAGGVAGVGHVAEACAIAWWRACR